MKKLLTVALAATMLALPLTACTAEDSSTAESAAGGAFVVGFDAEFPPMGFIAEDGTYTGFDLALAAEVADRLGLQFIAQPIAWDSKDQELNSGNIDCIWNGFTISGREEAYAWTEAYMANNQVVVVNADSSIASLADLAGAVVAVQKDSSGLAALEENTELLNSFAELVQVDDYLNAMMELESGAVDAIVMDEIVARYQIQESESNFVVLDESVASEEYGVGFALGNEALRDQVQETLEQMAEDGTLAQISIEWFGEDITTIGQ
jgi:amino acid ABC transporter substrate-binding protein, PAAT family (TC 3.A.1.3.-)